MILLGFRHMSLEDKRLNKKFSSELHELEKNMAHFYRARTLSALSAECKHDFDRLCSFGRTKANIEVNMEEQNNIKFYIRER